MARHNSLPLLLADLARESRAAIRHLAPLSRADARYLLAALLARAAQDEPEPIEPALIEPALIETVLDRADGVPFFLVAWASELCTGTCSPGVALHVIPPSVREGIRQRVIVLPDAARDVLAVVAVTGGSVSLPVLLAAARASSAHTTRTTRQEAELLSGVEAACIAGLLCESAENGYCFTHEIVRETVLDDLGGARRAILRREIDAALHGHASLASSGRCAGGRGRPARRRRQ